MIGSIVRIFQLFNSASRGISNNTTSDNADKLAVQLKTEPEKTPAMIQSLVQRCWYVNDDQIQNWDICLEKMPETFSLRNFQIVHRQIIGKQVLIVVRCYAQVLEGTLFGSRNVSQIFTFLFYVKHNPSTKNYEVMTQSYNDITEKNLQSSFGRMLLETMKAIKIG